MCVVHIHMPHQRVNHTILELMHALRMISFLLYVAKAKQSSSTSDMESSEDGKKEKSSLFSRAATPESSAASSRSHTPSYSPVSHDDTDFTQEVVDLTSGRCSDDDSF